MILPTIPDSVKLDLPFGFFKIYIVTSYYRSKYSLMSLQPLCKCFSNKTSNLFLAPKFKSILANKTKNSCPWCFNVLVKVIKVGSDSMSV